MSINHRRISLSIAANLLLEIINKISPLLILHHAQKSLGLADFGWAQFQMALFETLQPFISYGFANYALAHAKDNDPGEMRSMQSHLLTLKLVNALLVIGFYVLRQGSQVDLVSTGILFLVLSSTVFEAYWICVVRHKLVFVSMTTGVLRVITLIMILTLVQQPEDRSLFVLLSMLPNVIISFITGIYGYSAVSLGRVHWKKLRLILAQSTPFALVILLVTLLDRVDIFLVEHWFGIEAAGIYAAPAKIAQSLSLVFASVAVPFLAEIRKVDDPKVLYKHIVLSLWCLSVVVAPLLFGLPFVEETIVNLLFPKQPASALGLMSFLCIGLVGSMFQSVFGNQLLMAKGKPWSVFWGCALGLSLVPLLVWAVKDTYGIRSVAYAIVLAKWTTGLAAMYFARKYLAQIPWKPFLKPMAAAAGMGICLRLLGSTSFFVNVLVGMISYGLFLVLGNWQEFKELAARLRAKRRS